MAIKLEKLRKEAGLTQQKLADSINVKRSTVSMWESGKSKPRGVLFPKLAKILGCSIDELFEE